MSKSTRYSIGRESPATGKWVEIDSHERIDNANKWLKMLNRTMNDDNRYLLKKIVVTEDIIA